MSVEGFVVAAAIGIGVLTVSVSAQTGRVSGEQLFSAISEGDLARVESIIRSAPEVVKERNAKGQTPVIMAVYYQRPAIMAAVLGAAKDLDIYEAAATGDTIRLKALIAADRTVVNRFAKDGFFPLGLAVFFGHDEAARLLIEAGADVNSASRESMKVAPLHSAVARGRIEIARELLRRRAGVNARSAGGYAPLHEAAARGDIAFATLLLDNGAEIDAETDKKETPFALAVENGQKKMAEFLAKRGARQ